MGHTRIAPTDKLQCECQLRSEAEVCFGAYFSRTQDQFMQTAYQSTERLAMIYKMMNWNYTQYVGLMATVPVPGRKVVGFPLGSGGTIRAPPLRRLFRPSFRPEKVDFAVPMGQHVQAEQESDFRIARIHADSGHTRHIRPENGGYGRCRGKGPLRRTKPHSLPGVATYSIQVCRNVTYVTEVRT